MPDAQVGVPWAKVVPVPVVVVLRTVLRGLCLFQG